MLKKLLGVLADKLASFYEGRDFYRSRYRGISKPLHHLYSAYISEFPGVLEEAQLT